MKINIDSNEVEKLGVTPNQYCLAYTIFKKDRIGFLKLKSLYSKENYFKEDLFNLLSKGYLNNKNEDPYSIRFDECEILKIDFKENEVLDEDDGIYCNECANPKTQCLCNSEIDDDEEFELSDTGPHEVITDWDKFVQKFRETFPKGVLTGGKYVRSSTKDCEKKLKQFIKEYEFEEDIILQSTEKYVKRYQMSGYRFMKTASFFIIKDKISALADECEMLSDDDGGNNDNMFMTGI